MTSVANIKSWIVELFGLQLSILFLIVVALFTARLVLGYPPTFTLFPKDESIALLFLSALLGFGVACSLFNGKMIPTWRTGWSILGFTTISVIFGTYVARAFQELTRFNLGVLSVLISGLFFLTLPTALEAVKSLWSVTKSNVLRLIASMLIPLLSVYAVLTLVGKFQEKQRVEEEYVNAHPQIVSIEPTLVSNGDIVILRGAGFGPSQEDSHYKVLTSGNRELEVIKWLPRKIIIKINTATDPGEIRVVKRSRYLGQWGRRESNKVRLEYYEVSKSTEEQRRRYFGQLEDLSDEAKKLYGISSSQQ